MRISGSILGMGATTTSVPRVACWIDFDHRVLMMFGIYRGPALRQAHLNPQVYGLA
jgi:hypothetical protein